MNEPVGLREMRQNASDLVRRAEAGERVTITVSGRPAAVLGPVQSGAWRSWADIATIFASAGDETWLEERREIDELIDQEPRDPWDEA